MEVRGRGEVRIRRVREVERNRETLWNNRCRGYELQRAGSRRCESKDTPEEENTRRLGHRQRIIGKEWIGTAG